MPSSPSPMHPQPFSTSNFTSPIFSSTLPLARTTSDSALPRPKKSTKGYKDTANGESRRRTRSANSSVASASSGGNDFSMGDYTIDLAKLSGSFAGDPESSVTVPKKVVSEVGSVDDGPTDFTLNMEKWMKGTAVWKREKGKDEIVEDEAQFAGSPKDDGVSRAEAISKNEPTDYEHEEQELEEDESELGLVDSSTPSRLEGTRGPGVGKEDQPRFSRLDTEAWQDRAAEEVFSQISALQAEVERLRLEAEESHAEKRVLEEHHLLLKDDYEDVRQELHETRSVAAQLEQDLKREKDQVAREVAKRRDHGNKVGSLRAKFEPIAHELATVKKEAETAKQVADAKIAELEQKLKSSQEELATVQEVAKLQHRKLNAEIENLRTQLDKHILDLANHHHAFATREEDLNKRLSELQERVRTAEQSHSNATILRTELELAQEQLSETRRIVESVEDENDRFSQENERQARDIEEMKAELDEAKQSLEESDGRVQEMEVASLQLNGEIELAQLAKQNEEARRENSVQQVDVIEKKHTRELGLLKKKHEAETKSLKATLLRAAEGMKRREERLAKTKIEEISSLKQQIMSLEKENAKSAAASKASEPKKSNLESETVVTPSTTELHNAIRILSLKFKSSQADLAHTQGELVFSREQVEGVRRINKEVNEELEKQWTEAIEKREAEWRRRIHVVLQDRDRLAKALMWTWGKEEVGPIKAEGAKEGEERMGYRYKYVKR
ncbi:hypothetical protein MMC06_002377 [Schaereria dolodes]|nr:hypothetical protein [Schaereria dolodes]